MGITHSRDIFAKECKKDWHLPPDTLVCLRKGQHLSPALVWVCVVWGRVLPPNILMPVFMCSYWLQLCLLPVDFPGMSQDCGVRFGGAAKAGSALQVQLSSGSSQTFNAELLSMEMHFTIKSILKKKARSQVTQGIAVGWLVGKAVGSKQPRRVRVLSHLQRFSGCLVPPIIKLSLWVFQVDASQGLECRLTGRNQKQHVLVMLRQLWITRNIRGFVLEIQMPSTVSSQLLLLWANLVICHRQNICCDLDFGPTDICLICLCGSSKSGVNFCLNWNLYCPCNPESRGQHWTCSGDDLCFIPNNLGD